MCVSSLLGFLEGLMALTDALESELYELEKQEEGEEAMELTTYAQRLGREEGYKEGIEEGIEQGIEQGLEQGIEQGKQEGQREGLLTAIGLALQLSHKESLIPEVKKIRDFDRLQEFYVKLLSGVQMDELRKLCLVNGNGA
jgi:hypothetical protein